MILIFATTYGGPLVQTARVYLRTNSKNIVTNARVHTSVNRFTNPGDTVACLSAEKNKCADVAISRGRQVEAFVSSPEALEELNTRVVSSFATAFDNGFFKVR